MVTADAFVPLSYAMPIAEARLGQQVVVNLPGEIVLCQVVAIADADHAVVEMTGIPMTRNHTYRKGDKFPIERKVTPLGEVWEAMDERLLAMRAAAEKEKARPKRRTAKRKKGGKRAVVRK